MNYGENKELRKNHFEITKVLFVLYNEEKVAEKCSLHFQTTTCSTVQIIESFINFATLI